MFTDNLWYLAKIALGTTFLVLVVLWITNVFRGRLLTFIRRQTNNGSPFRFCSYQECQERAFVCARNAALELQRTLRSSTILDPDKLTSDQKMALARALGGAREAIDCALILLSRSEPEREEEQRA